MGNVVTRFQNGVTNVGDTSPFAGLRMPDPTLYHTYLDDFDQFVAADWTVTETQAGATQALTAGDGGWLALVNSAGGIGGFIGGLLISTWGGLKTRRIYGVLVPIVVSAIGVIVHVERGSDGVRRIVGFARPVLVDGRLGVEAMT